MDIPFDILCVLALFIILVLYILLYFIYKTAERITANRREKERMAQEEEESKRKIVEEYRKKYFDALGQKALVDEMKKRDAKEFDAYIDALKPLCKLPK